MLCYLSPFTPIVLLLQQMTASIGLGPICSLYGLLYKTLVSLLYFPAATLYEWCQILCATEEKTFHSLPQSHISHVVHYICAYPDDKNGVVPTRKANHDTHGKNGFCTGKILAFVFLWSKSAIERHACGGTHKKCIGAGKHSQIHKTHKVFSRDCKSNSWTLVGREGPVSSTHNTVEYCFFFHFFVTVQWHKNVHQGLAESTIQNQPYWMMGNGDLILVKSLNQWFLLEVWISGCTHCWLGSEGMVHSRYGLESWLLSSIHQALSNFDVRSLKKNRYSIHVQTVSSYKIDK